VGQITTAGKTRTETKAPCETGTETKPQPSPHLTPRRRQPPVPATFALVECFFVRWRTRDGRYTVEVVRLSLTGRHRDGDWIRVEEHGCHVADVRTVDELAEFIDLADLDEALRRVTGLAS
jgi:hypothetical protein